MSRQPQVIRQRWLFPRCFLLVCVRWVAPPQRETVYIAQCCHLSPVRALINILLPIDSKPDNDFWLPLACTFEIRITVFDYLPFHNSNCSLSWVCICVCFSDHLASEFLLLNKQQRLCLTLVCAWFLEWHVTAPSTPFTEMSPALLNSIFLPWRKT